MNKVETGSDSFVRYGSLFRAVEISRFCPFLIASIPFSEHERELLEINEKHQL